MRWLMGIGFVVAWSSGFVGATLAARSGAGTLPLLAWRYLATAAVLVVVGLLSPQVRKSLRSLRRLELVRQVVLGVLSHAVFLGGVFWAADRGLDAGTSALVCALQPMLVAAASTVLFGDRLGSVQWAGLLVALVGVGLSVGGVAASSARLEVGVVAGSLLALCGASLLERAWKSQLPVLASLLIQVLVGAVVFAGVALATSGLAVEVSGLFLMAVGWLVVLSGLAGYGTFTWCLRRLGATVTSTLLYFTAPVTMLWAWVMFGQRPSPMQWLGLVVVMVGVLLSVRPGKGLAGGRSAATRKDVSNHG